MPADWLPQNHEELYDQANHTTAYLGVTANRTRMGFAATTPQGVWLDTDYTPKYTVFKTAYEEWENPATRTKIMEEKLDETEAVFRPAYRQLYIGFLKGNPLVTNDDLVAMGLPTPTGERHPAPVATTAPVCEPDTSVIRRVTIHYFRSGGTHRKGKPAGQHGVEIRWAVLDTQPVDVAELINSSFDTSSPFTLAFEGHDRGKMLYFALRWENTTGEKGPWGEIIGVIIP